MMNVEGMTPSITSKNQWIVDHMATYVNEDDDFVPFVFLTETWCKSYITDAQLSLQNYSLHRADRKLRRRGGSIIYVHEIFCVSQSLSFDNQYVEVVLLHIDDIKASLVCVYRPPNCPLHKFKEAVEFIDQNLDKGDDWTLYIAGDFNLPVIDWDTLSLKKGYTTEEQESAHLLMDFKSKTFTSQYVNIDTRKVSGETGNTLDLFFTNDPELVQDISTEDTIMSDHKMVKVNLGYDISRGESTTPEEISNNHQPEETASPSLSQLDLKKADFEKINEQLRNIDWDNLRASNSEEGFVDVFYKEVLQACQDNAPVKKKQCSTKSENVNLSTQKILRNHSRKRGKIRKRLKFLTTFQPQSPTIQVLNNKLKSLETQSKDAIIRDKEAQERRAVEVIKSNPRYFYSYAKRFSKRKSKVGPLKLSKRNITSLIKDPKRMADALQDQFKSVFSDPNSINADQYNYSNVDQTTDRPTLESFIFTIQDIIRAISEIKSSSSSGEDGFSVALLKNCKETLAYPIFLIWKNSFESGSIHKNFLSQMITPVHKKRLQISTCKLQTHCSHISYHQDIRTNN